MRPRALVAALIAAVVVVVLALTLGPGSTRAWQALPWQSLPWQPACTVLDSSGTVLARGSPAEVAAILYIAEADLAGALGDGPAVACRISAITPTSTPKELPAGLTPRALALRAEVRDEFGDVPAGGFGPEEVLPGRSPAGEHSLGRAIDFFFRPYERSAREREGWRLANWAVANAERLGIRTVIYRDRIWTARRSAQGWREYRFSGRDPDNPVNRHLDHVHLDVA